MLLRKSDANYFLMSKPAIELINTNRLNGLSLSDLW